MKKRRLAGCLLVLALAEMAGAQEVFVSMKETSPGAYALEGHFFVEAPISVAWNVLTDYNHIADFVSSMKQSRVESGGAGAFLVDQKAQGEFFLFARTVHVLLDTREKPFENIGFEDTLHEDFDHYAGSWRLEQTKEAVLICYSLNVKSNFPAPRFIKKRVVKTNVLALLEQVKSEILKRAGLLLQPR